MRIGDEVLAACGARGPKRTGDEDQSRCGEGPGTHGADSKPAGPCRERKDVSGGAERDRTLGLLNAIQALSQTELQPHTQEGREE